MQDKLTGYLIAFLIGEINFEELEDLFYDPFMEFEGELKQNVEHVFQLICEKMDVTMNEPIPQEDRSFGWINTVEFGDWLRNVLTANEIKVPE